MIDHISLGTHRYGDAVAFYRQALEPLGLGLMRDTGGEAAFGTPDKWWFYLYPVEPGEGIAAKGTHLALAAASRRVVEAAHAAALAAGGSDVFTPRTRPDVSATYYGAMFKDLDGHAVEVLTNAAA